MDMVLNKASAFRESVILGIILTRKPVVLPALISARTVLVAIAAIFAQKIHSSVKAQTLVSAATVTFVLMITARLITTTKRALTLMTARPLNAQLTTPFTLDLSPTIRQATSQKEEICTLLPTTRPAPT